MVYPKHNFEPEDLLNFIELKWFTKDWDGFGFPDEELGALQIAIMCDPKRWPVVSGTDGLRKMRYSPLSSNKGKSGALRICYVYFEKYFTVLLVVVYAKGEQDNLPESAKKAMNKAIGRIGSELKIQFES